MNDSHLCSVAIRGTSVLVPCLVLEPAFSRLPGRKAS